MKKYELTTNFKIDASGIKMYQIKALKDFGDVKKGDLGGYIEREENLSQDGNSWVAGSVLVCGSTVPAIERLRLFTKNSQFKLKYML